MLHPRYISGARRIAPSDSAYVTCLTAFCLPERVAFRVESQSPPGLGVLDLIFHLPVADQLIAHDAAMSGSVTCSDLPGSHARESAVLNAPAHIDS